jgi:hypothetical protein
MNVDNDGWDDDAGGIGDDEDEDEDNMDEDDDDDVDDGGGDDDGDDDGVDVEEILRKAQLEFQDDCEAARRNDPAKTTIYASIVKGYGIPLGNALVGNTHVQNLHLRLLPENVNSPDDENWGVHNIAPLLQYLREGEAFRALHTSGGSVEYTSACVRALAQNPNTKSLILDNETEIPLLEMVDLLRNHEMLQHLFMPMMNSTALAEALHANQSLEVLVLTVDPDAWPKPNGVMLRHLHSHSKLQRLSLIRKHDCSSLDTDQVDVALCSLLSNSFTKLKIMQLFNFTFDRSRTDLFIEGLRANRSLQKLELFECEFKAEAVAILDSLVLSPTKHHAFSACPMRQLVVHQNDDALLVALLTLVFSNLEVLEWHWNREVNVDAFWNRLKVADTSRIHLQTLRLEYWPTRKCDAMNSCIPKLITLHELHFFALSSYDWDHLHGSQFLEAGRSFVKAIRQSSSLLVVSVDSVGQYRFQAVSGFLEASLRRNAMLPELLSTPRSDPVLHANGAELHLYPSLFSVAQQSPYGVLKSILTGLLALNDDVGPT